MDGDLRLLTIVGVVGDVRKHGLEKQPRPTVYVNYRQRARSANQFDVVLRTSGEPTAIFGAARGVLNQIDPTVPPRLNTFAEVFSDSVTTRRFNLLLVGVFGVLAYSVAQRRREFGVRIALGASPRAILRMVLAQGMLTIAIGTAIGLAGSFALTRTMRSLLFEVSPNDPLTIAGVAVLLVLIAALASYIPARRATRVDPTIALRYE
jgi:ABC-type antimicrobial peptide transport system permease subunit